jgi:hypothetical protein
MAGQRETQMTEYQLRDTHRRIENLLAEVPQDGWALDEAQAVLAVLAGIVRVRQASIAGLSVATTLAYPAGHVVARDVGRPLRAAS